MCRSALHALDTGSRLGQLETSIEVVEIAAVGLDEVLDATVASAVREARDALWSWQRSAIARVRQR